jgi:hypothetical protein
VTAALTLNRPHLACSTASSASAVWKVCICLQACMLPDWIESHQSSKYNQHSLADVRENRGRTALICQTLEEPSGHQSLLETVCWATAPGAAYRLQWQVRGAVQCSAVCSYKLLQQQCCNRTPGSRWSLVFFASEALPIWQLRDCALSTVLFACCCSCCICQGWCSGSLAVRTYLPTSCILSREGCA